MALSFFIGPAEIIIARDGENLFHKKRHLGWGSRRNTAALGFSGRKPRPRRRGKGRKLKKGHTRVAFKGIRLRRRGMPRARQILCFWNLPERGAKPPARAALLELVRKTRSAFCPAARKHLASVPVGHPFPEAMLLLPVKLLGLIGSQHR